MLTSSPNIKKTTQKTLLYKTNMKIFIKNFNELTLDELHDLLQLRSQIFIVEQDCVYQDIDGRISRSRASPSLARIVSITSSAQVNAAANARRTIFTR